MLYGSIMPETHLGPVATSSYLSAVLVRLWTKTAVESALTFLKQCVKEAGWVVGSTTGLRWENNNLAWNSVYPQQHIECIQHEYTPFICLTLSFISTTYYLILFPTLCLPKFQIFFSRKQYCIALFGSECNKVLCVQSRWEGVGYVNRKKNSFIMLISW